MKLRKTLTLILLSSMSMLNAQTTWYFGTNSGVKFTGNVASSINSSAINTNEGAAGIVDQNNNVVLYTDGSKVWNGNHTLQLTINTGTYAAGMTNSTHAAAICPIPGTNNQYFYIFTVTDGITSVGTGYNGGYGPLKVSKVKVTGVAPNTTITFDNITTDKNITITPPNVRVGEKIAITTDETCGYWVSVHGVGVYGGNFQKIFNNAGESTFYTYHVTPSNTNISALQSSSVTSVFTSGAHKAWNYSYLGGDSNTTPYNFTPSAQTTVKGQMKFNHKGNRLACAVTSGQHFQLYDFDKATGTYSNQIIVGGFSPGGPKGWCGNGLPYGVEFSPNGNLLYITTNFTTAGYNGFIQFNVQSSNTNSAMIQNSSCFIDEVLNQPSPYGGLQRGPDGNIYMAYKLPSFTTGSVQYYNLNPDTDQGIGPIQSPWTGVSGSYTGGTKLGLPTVLQLNPVPVISSSVTISNTVVCSGSQITVNANYNGNIAIEYHGWILEECTQSGVSVAGGYNSNVIWDPNTLGTPYTFNSAQLACNKYYKITSVVQNLTNCLNWTLSEPKIIYLSCTPNGLTSINNNCLGNSLTLCIDEIYEQPSTTYTVSWGKRGSNINCVNVTPTTSGQTTYAATITNTITGCVGQKQFIVNSYSAPNPNFSYLVNTSNSLYNTITATPNDLSGINTLGYEEKWKIEKLDATGNVLSNTELGSNPNPSCWQTQVVGYTNFNGYDNINNVTCSGTQGNFNKNTTYRITRYVRNAYCSQWQSYSPSIISPFRKKNDDLSEISNSSNNKLALALFPNPSNGLLNINLDNAIDSKYNIEVFDIYGKSVYKTEKLNTNGTEFKAEINLADLNLANGLYLINVSSNNQSSSQRIMIEK